MTVINSNHPSGLNKASQSRFPWKPIPGVAQYVYISPIFLGGSQISTHFLADNDSITDKTSGLVWKLAPPIISFLVLGREWGNGMVVNSCGSFPPLPAEQRHSSMLLHHCPPQTLRPVIAWFTAQFSVTYPGQWQIIPPLVVFQTHVVSLGKSH